VNRTDALLMQPMTMEAIRHYLDATPFTPIKLITTSGKSYLLPHPEFLTFSPTGRR
jgi:hypothetical protein